MTILLDGLTLPEDLTWTDEFTWHPVEQNQGRTLGGRLIVQSRQLHGGRPITLSGERLLTWLTRLELQQLATLAEVDQAMSLTLNDGRVFNVLFRFSDSPYDVEPITDDNTPADDDVYALTALRLINV